MRNILTRLLLASVLLFGAWTSPWAARLQNQQDLFNQLGGTPVVITGTPPVFPANSLALGSPGPNSIPLSCTGVTGIVTTYQFYIEQTGSNITNLLGTPQAACALTATGLVTGQSYTFYVIATGPGGSTQSNTVSTATQATAPGPFTLTSSNLTSTGITLTWTLPTGSQPVMYQPQVKPFSASVFSNIGTSTASLTEDLTGLLAPSTTYTFQVLASNVASNPPGVPSSSVTVTTPAASGGGCTPPTDAVLNPCDTSANIVLSGGNLTGTLTASTASGSRGTTSHATGKWIYSMTLGTGGASFQLGLASGAWTETTTLGAATTSFGANKAGTVAGAGSVATNATWNPADKSATITLTGTNLTATTQDGAGTQAVRGTTSWSTGKVYIEYTAGTSVGTTPWGGDTFIGFGNSAACGPPTTCATDPVFDASARNSVFIVPGFNSQAYLGNVQISANGSAADVNGAVYSLAIDFTAQKLWYTTTAMRGAGFDWNWGLLAAQNPATGTGGISFAGVSAGPFFPYFGSFFSDPLTVNAGGSAYTVAKPAGFSDWNTTGSSTVASFANGNTVNLAWDANAALAWLQTCVAGVCGNWNNSGAANPASGQGGISLANLATGTLFPAIADATTADTFSVNMGAGSSLTIPSGFLAWNGSVGGGVGVLAAKTNSFIDSWGVNTHFSFINEAERTLGATQVVNDMTFLGLHRLRDQQITGWLPGATATVGAAGILIDDILQTGGTCEGILSNALSDFALLGTAGPAGANALSSWEGPNELNASPQATCGGQGTGDNGTGAAGAITRQLVIVMGNAIKSNATVRVLPILEPSLAIGLAQWNIPAYQANMGNLTNACTGGTSCVDYANWHDYHNPAGLAGQPHADRVAAIGLGQNTAPGMPPMATESGYQLAGGSGFSFASQRADGMMELNNMLDAVRVGMVWYFKYNMYDFGGESFGFWSFPGHVARTQAQDVHNLTILLNDTGSQAFSPGRLNYSLSCSGSGCSQAPFSLLGQKANGHFWIPVWNETSVWNSNTNADVTPVAAATTVNFGQGVSRADVYDPIIGTSSQANCTNCSSITVNLIGYPMLIEVTP